MYNGGKEVEQETSYCQEIQIHKIVGNDKLNRYSQLSIVGEWRPATS